MTAVAKSARETLGLPIVRELFPDHAPETVASITARLASALTYLLLRRRKIRTFDGMDLQSDETWARLLRIAAMMVAGALP